MIVSSRLALKFNLDLLGTEVALADGFYHRPTTKRDLHLAKKYFP